jgi:hypothetical protein
MDGRAPHPSPVNSLNKDYDIYIERLRKWANRKNGAGTVRPARFYSFFLFQKLRERWNKHLISNRFLFRLVKKPGAVNSLSLEVRKKSRKSMGGNFVFRIRPTTTAGPARPGPAENQAILHTIINIDSSFYGVLKRIRVWPYLVAIISERLPLTNVFRHFHFSCGSIIYLPNSRLCQ